MANREITREDDERDLLMLTRLRQGIARKHIAQEIGLSYKITNNRIRAICAADIAHDPDAAKYWSMT